MIMVTQATCIFDGFFRSSPVGLVEKVPGEGMWRIFRHTFKNNDIGQSTSSWIDSDKFPTTHFTTSWVAHFMSHFLLLIMVSSVPYLVFSPPFLSFFNFLHASPHIHVP